MKRRRPLRSLLAIALLGVLLLLLRTPPCDPEVCSMDVVAMTSACHPMAADCCQEAGASHAPVQVIAPGPAVVGAVEIAALSAPPRDFREPLAAPAIVQGVGLHTLLAVFLI